MGSITPMMRQYLDLKDEYKDCILFFRLGDFYEMFFEDALTASKELEIALTGRDCGLKERAPMCGVPYHSADNYISKLVNKGFKVAICEQVEDPSQAKGIVKRDVVKVITPGTVIDSHMLEEKENNYIASVYIESQAVGITYADISTGEIKTTEIRGNKFIDHLIDELVKIVPSEIIINTLIFDSINLEHLIKSNINSFLTVFDEAFYSFKESSKLIKSHFDSNAIERFGIDIHQFSIQSTGALLEYLRRTQKNSLGHITKINYYSNLEFMVLDKSTRRNLELIETIRDKKKKGSLLWLLDKTNTAMGARTLKKWIEEPLLDIDRIQERLDLVEELLDKVLIKEDVKSHLKCVYDLERLIGRVSYGNANGRDLVALKNSLMAVPKILMLIKDLASVKSKKIVGEIDCVEEVAALIEAAIDDNPPTTIKEGNIIKNSYNRDLDELRDIVINGKTWIANMEETEKKTTGIKSLKIGFNKVFGYYLDVTKSNLSLVPDHYIRKQTLANSERYITPELKEVESKLLGSEEKIMELEYQLFNQVREEVKLHTKRIQKTARAIATLDALISLTDVAEENNYCKPTITLDGEINIKDGRHPVVEKSVTDHRFVSNDTLLDRDENRFAIITGPNMAGKSTYMRQVALIVLMAQIGSFIPAEKASIGLTDRIFTRVGASDDLSQGQSTFMVEMSELANILNNATGSSLIILDEIGRGTSTYDGLSIAWSVVEYISSKKLGARTLFATHYHELTELEGTLEGVKNYCITVKEKGDDIIFLRKIVRGSADQSYGIQVAKLAGITNEITKRANEILKQLEDHDINNKKTKTKDSQGLQEAQLSFLRTENDDLLSELVNMNILEMTPMEAMNRLYQLVKYAKGDKNE